MRERTIDVGGTELCVAEAGTGGRPFLLLHGFTGAKEDFTEWLDPLAERGWHAVAPDHRGHGASAKPMDEAAYSFTILATDALGLADALGWDRFALLGYSMGGMVAQFIAAQRPERLDALVLMDTSHGRVEGIDEAQAEAAIGIVRERGIDGLADVMATREPVLETPAHRRLLTERPGYAAFGDRKLRGTAASLYAAMVQEMLAVEDRLPHLATLPANLPTLVIVGEQDRPFVAASHRLAATIPGARLVVVPDAGHCPQFEAPQAWWDALAAFLTKVSG